MSNHEWGRGGDWAMILGILFFAYVIWAGTKGIL